MKTFIAKQLNLMWGVTITLLLGYSMLGIAIPASAYTSSDDAPTVDTYGSVHNQPMTEYSTSLLGTSTSTSSGGVSIYGWPQIDSIHAPNSKYVSVHGWWTTDRNELKNSKAKVTSILMVKNWYGYSHIGTSNTSAATKEIYPNQTSKRSNARADCKNSDSNTFWAMTVLSGANVKVAGTKSNEPVTSNCTPK